MVTSDTVNYSYVYIGLLKTTGLTNVYREYLLLYQKYDDGIICIYNHSLPNIDTKFNKLYQHLNNWGKPCWISIGFLSSL